MERYKNESMGRERVCVWWGGGGGRGAEREGGGGREREGEP